MPARVRVVGHTFEHQSRCSVRKRSVDDVAVACNPSDIRRAPVNIAVVIVENVLMGHGGVNEITARRMQHALRFSSRARRIKYEQWVFRAHRLGRAIGRSVRYCFVIPNVTTVDPIDVATSPFDHNDCLILSHSSAAASVFALRTGRPPRRPSSAVMTTFDSQSSTRPASASGESAKTTE